MKTSLRKILTVLIFIALSTTTLFAQEFDLPDVERFFPSLLMDKMENL